MTLIIPPGFGLGVLRWNLASDPEEMLCTLGLDLGAVGGDFQAATVKLSVEALNHITSAAKMNSAYTFRGTRLYVGQDGAPPLVFESNTGVVGTDGGGVLPQNTAFLVRKLSASAGRRNRGRMYVPPFRLPETVIDSAGVIQASSVGTIQNEYNLWLVGLQTTNASGPEIPPVLLHSEGISATPAPTPISAFHVQPVIATMRQRLRR